MIKEGIVWISGLGSGMDELYEIRRRLERRCENGRIA